MYSLIDRQYKQLLRDILDHGAEDFNARTGSTVKALSGRTLQVDLAESFPLVSLRPIPTTTFIAETMFYLQGKTNPAWLQQFTKIWDPFLTDGQLPDSYGHRWKSAFGRDQIEQLVQLLKKDPSSRHGVVAMWDPRSDGLMGESKPNVPCPMSFTCQVVGGRLDMCVTVRSQDCYLGLPTDVAGFALLTHLLAEEIGVPPGRYTHFIVNAHLYANQWLNAEVLANRTSKQQAMPLKTPRGAFKRSTEGDNSLVYELKDLVLAKYTPLGILPKVPIVI